MKQIIMFEETCNPLVSDFIREITLQPTWAKLGTACLSEAELEWEEDVFEDDEWWSEARLVVVLHHQEVHPILPDLDRVHLHLLKYMPAKPTTKPSTTAEGEWYLDVQ